MNQETPDLQNRIRELGPWHFDLELAHGVRTGDSTNRDRSNTGAVSMVHTEHAFKDMMRTVWPDGL